MSITKTITDTLGRVRKVTYRHRYQNLKPGQFYYFRGTPAQIHSLRVLISRWNLRKGTSLVGRKTKSGSFRIENWATTATA